MSVQDCKENMDWDSLMGAEVDDDCDTSDDLRKSDVACICPSCSRSHSIKMLWTGRGTPRKFCNSCRNIHDFTDSP